MLDAIDKLWPTFLSLIGLGVWLVRLEAKVMNLEKELKEKKDRDETKERTLWDKFEKVLDKIQEVGEALARLEGKIEYKMDQWTK